MTPLDYLCRAAQEAKAIRTNYVIVVRGSKVLAQGGDLQAASKDDVRGATLYFFCEPSLSELMLAEAAGIEAVHYGVSIRDAVRHGLCPLHLKPQCIRYCRETIIKDYVATWNENISSPT